MSEMSITPNEAWVFLFSLLSMHLVEGFPIMSTTAPTHFCFLTALRACAHLAIINIINHVNWMTQNAVIRTHSDVTKIEVTRANVIKAVRIKS